MKKLLIMLLISVNILTGCGNSPGKDSGAAANTATPEQSSTPSIQPSVQPSSTPAATPATETPAATATPKSTDNTQIELNFEYSRQPSIADWNFLKKTLTSLNEAQSGDMLDIRLADLSSLDLTNDYGKMKNIWFDTYTKWPQKLPEGFDPVIALELGRNPGLGIRSLQEKGITGKGVNIAIIDQTLLIEHDEYRNELRKYDEVNAPGGPAAMHGPFVASISVGKSCGVAPEAGLYFVASNNADFETDGSYTINYTNYAEAINKIVEINKNLPKDQKIRALSISAIWTPENKGYKELTDAIEKAKKEGIFVLSCDLFETYGFFYYGMDREPMADPESPESFKAYDWNSWTGMVSRFPGAVDYYETNLKDNFKGEMLMCPIGSRTYAEPTGIDAYSFDTNGGWSCMEPYIAGLYALACQVKPDITPEEFWKAALDTGDPKEVTKGDEKYPARMVDPVKLIEFLQKNQ